MNQNVFCIAGMHRSGTSLMASWFYYSNIFIGKSLYGSTSTNVKGHFEDMDILNFHKADLRRKGYHISGLMVDEEQFDFDETSQREACSILEKRKGSLVWGWKEPRSTLYLQSWKRLIPQLKIIGIYREPSAVVDSLYSRLRKNKWHKTSNPFKKLWWYIDVDLNEKKWKKIFHYTYDRYNMELINFKEKYPDDIVIFSLDDIKSSPLKAQLIIQEKLNISMCSFDDIFSDELLTRTNSAKPCSETVYLKLEEIKVKVI